MIPFINQWFPGVEQGSVVKKLTQIICVNMVRYIRVWLKVIDTPNRWFPTKYNNSCGSFGTPILSHCHMTLRFMDVYGRYLDLGPSSDKLLPHQLCYLDHPQAWFSQWRLQNTLCIVHICIHITQNRTESLVHTPHHIPWCSHYFLIWVETSLFRPWQVGASLFLTEKSGGI